MNRNLRFILLMVAGWLMHGNANAQNNIAVKEFIAAIDTFSNRMPVEKVFVQTDKPYYTTIDTIWLKAYVLDAAFNYSHQSDLLYTELIDDTGKVIIRQSMLIKSGISFGQIALDPDVVPEGSYTLRAYTNWMQNQGEQSFFTKQLYVSMLNENPWLVSTDSRLMNKQGIQNSETALSFTDLNKKPVRLREMQLSIKTGNKLLTKSNLQTDLDGKMNFNFNLPRENTHGRLTIMAQDMRKGEGNKTLVIPVALNRPENTDLQFMPEGGHLVAGLLSIVGFKAIGEDGKEVPISGTIVNSKGEVINRFRSIHLGMGSFELRPVAGETYSAKVDFANGSTKTYPLPQVKPTGIVMHIDNVAKNDSLLVSIDASRNIIGSNLTYSLIGQSGGKVCYAANLSFVNGIIHGHIDKSRFHSGITRFTLFSADKHSIAERQVFIDHNDELTISLDTNKIIWQPKDSVALHIHVTDAEHKPVSGSFSLAVTDDGQVKADSTNIANIKSYMLLTGDLKGTVEQPGYYFDGNNKDGLTTLDNLMLTQGWVSYDWADVFNPKYKPAFKAENSLEVAGWLSRTGGLALSGLRVTLLSTKNPLLAMDMVSDANGRFVFKNLPPIDTPNLLVQVKDRKGRMFEANVNVDEFIPANITSRNVLPLKPWYVNSDSTLLNYLNKSRDYARELDNIKYPTGSHRLKEVVIKGQKIIKGSHFFAGAGAVPDIVLNEADMKKANKMTIEDLLIKKVPGFHATPWPCGGIPEKIDYCIYCQLAAISIDGVPIDFTYSPPNMQSYSDHYGFQRSYIYNFTAEDVRGIEVKYPGYIEITTWSGNGEFMKRTRGRYLYRPLPVSWPKQFYRPKYTSKSNNALADLRSTIHWEPNIITDTAGNATVSFYSKSMPGTYTIILQGTDLNGSVGYQRKKIIVKK